ncbi:MAG: DNRLRE domain-containing protein [Methanothrix sp.]|nr:DNRLRE domain-containing protein [Methanothrix sp.]
MRHLYAFISIFLLLAATAAAGSFTAEMDVDTYVDSDNANQSFADSDLLWAASVDGASNKEVYLSFVNLLGSQGIFKPEQVADATLTVDAVKVDKPGKITAYFLHGATLETADWYTKEDYDADVSSSSVEIDGEGSYELDVTPIIKKAVETCTEGCPYTIVLVAEDDASVAIASSESSDGDKPDLEYSTEE